MKIKVRFVLLTCLAFGLSLRGQGTFVYDQQSALEASHGEIATDIQSNQLIGQSFTPSLSGIGFIRVWLSDGSFSGSGTTVYLNLLSGSITGAVLSATAPVTLSNAFIGHVTFLFPNEVSLNAGTTYYFRPVIQSGDSFSMGNDTKWHYPGGMMFVRGQPAPDYDVWFREGIIIPEPSASAMLIVGAALVVFARRMQK